VAVGRLEFHERKQEFVGAAGDQSHSAGYILHVFLVFKFASSNSSASGGNSEASDGAVDVALPKSLAMVSQQPSDRSTASRWRRSGSVSPPGDCRMVSREVRSRMILHGSNSSPCPVAFKKPPLPSRISFRCRSHL
jgi:hypothetical protein